MKILAIISFALCLSPVLMAQQVTELQYAQAQNYKLLGQGVAVTVQGDTSDRVPGMAYARLPLASRSRFRPELWSLGMNSAGLSVRFRSNSPVIGVRWEPLNQFAMNHMSATGVRGLDLYILDGKEWRYAGSAQPQNKAACRAVIISGMDTIFREYMLNLPLYDGLKSLEIGIEQGADISMPQIDLPRTNRPIVFYGTSITQGGCASRPGMAYPAIIGRKLQRQTINLGFSGNARMDASVGELLISIDAGIYFIDCLANCTADLVRARGYSFIKALLDAKPDIPVIMVSHQLEPKARFSRSLENNLKEINRLWEEIYQRLLAEGYNQLRFIPADNLTGHDGESTVDGAHLTDLGFSRIAEELMRYCNQ